jgi:hypothetical protein
LRGHRHRGELRLVAHLGKKDDSERCEENTKIHV